MHVLDINFNLVGFPVFQQNIDKSLEKQNGPISTEKQKKVSDEKQNYRTESKTDRK